MYLLGDIHLQLEHVSMVGGVHKVKNRPDQSGFSILFNGSHTHEQVFPDVTSAYAAHGALITALEAVDTKSAPV